jgi:hypothetical protein
LGTAATRVTNNALAERIRLIRVERFGEAGAAALAQKLGVPAATWANYEYGVTIPGPVLLQFLAITAVEPHWLLTGHGARYRHVPEAP